MLIGALAWGFNTGNAWHPVDRHGYASVPAFVAGWPTSELPRHAGALQLLWTANQLRHQRHPGKRALALGITGASMAGLAALDRAAQRSAQELEGALVDALGANYADRVAVPERAWASETVAPVGPLGMLAIHRRYVQPEQISYGSAGRANQLDVWRRREITAGASAPVLLQIPGGAWVTGAKRGQAYPLMSHMVEQGWVCVSISYRLGPRNRWPAQIVDVKRSIDWIRRSIASYGGDPDFIAVTGGSAGGHLSALAALTANDRSLQPGFEDTDTSVQAAVPFYGAYDWTNRDGTGHKLLVGHVERLVLGAKLAAGADAFDLASPMSRVRPDAPPFFVLHGVNDAFIPIEQADSFVRLLRAVAERPVAYARLARAQHAFDVFGSVRARHTAEAVGRFLGVVYGDYLAAAGPNG